MDNLENIRITVCEHTNKPVVQEIFNNEWVCLHGDTEQDDLELIKQIENGK